ncbi:MAG: serpin family protein [Bdellovibrionaceae bacterium]|nr:serpin family protein [Pseudobdellovibrionaceae bacterium]
MKIFSRPLLGIALVTALLSHNTFAQALDVSSHAFAVRTLKHLSAKNTGKNIVFSPSSLSAAMVTILAGASEKDQKIVLKSMGYGDATIKEILEDSQRFEKSLVAEEGYRVVSKNALFTNVALDPKYKTQIESSLNAQNDVIDFTKPESAALVNEWANKSTDGKIKEIVKAQDISRLAFLSLNATMFEAKWANAKFDSPRMEADFVNEAGQKIGKVKMMVSSPRIRIAQKAYEKFKVYEIPYALDSKGESQGSMMIILPTIKNEKEVMASRWSEKPVAPIVTPLAEALASLDAEQIAQIDKDIKSMRAAKEVYSILLNMPKFKTESDFSDELKNMLTTMGAGSIFKQIDVSGMVVEKSKKRWSHSVVALVKQKAVIEVAEEGTTAAAVSAIGGFPESCPPPSVYLNRPFAYLIKDGATGRIVFAGTFVAPK